MPLALFALQAPTLLNNLAQAPAWQIQWTAIGEIDFQERDLISCSEWDGELPDLFVGCVPEHHEWASSCIPEVPRYHMIHSSCVNDMGGDPSGHHVLGLQQRGMDLCTSSYAVAWSMVLSPAYDPRPVWRFQPSSPWGMMSRPRKRPVEVQERMARMKQQIPSLRLYGQDQADGFLAGDERARRMAGCSCFVGMVDPRSGFGLAEHEAMAAGVPVVARAWGDMMSLMPDHAGLARSDDELVELARRCSVDRSFAEQLSQSGLRYIAEHRTQDKLRQGVRALLANASERRLDFF